MGINRPIPNSKEYTGDALTDRIQRTIAELVARVKYILTTLGVMGLGSIDIELPDRDYTLTADEAAHVHWYFTGTRTAARKIIVPAASARSRSYVRWAENQTVGGFDIRMVSAGGTPFVDIANGSTRALIVKNNELAALI